ncbi:MAG: glycoside hydrolase family 57 protein [Methanocellales archaeon]|nr:glycoside hydrolase family 57 protein [Methanocellales archaeon]
MPPLCLYFQVHQPMRLRHFSVFSMGLHGDPYEMYFDLPYNRQIFERVARKCYFPTNKLLLELIREFEEFKVCFSLSGVFMEQCQQFVPDVLETFRQLADTGKAEFLDETYFHSLASLYEDDGEFREQVQMHREATTDLLGYVPKVFRNTEAMYNNRIAKIAETMGYKGIITEGSERILGWRSPNYLYKPVNSNIKVLLRNYPLSDDIAFRFSAREWSQHPLTADKFASWVSMCEGDCVNIFIDYETFGEHQWKETGIFEFLEHLPSEVLNKNTSFLTPSELIQGYEPVGEIDVPFTLSWADMARDVSAWLGNEMQVACFDELRKLEKQIKGKGDKRLLHIWRLLQTSDHLYYVGTKGSGDGSVHAYFNPYGSPYEGFINYMNIIQDLKHRASV